tara:strand:- start:219 stop:425 length:207 start_codon:yes stop_codon:yes gene_type:complete
MTKGEEAFIDQYTRKLLVGWADLGVQGEAIPNRPCHYFNHARKKGWVSKKSHTLTAKGYQVAASFLKR